MKNIPHISDGSVIEIEFLGVFFFTQATLHHLIRVVFFRSKLLPHSKPTYLNFYDRNDRKFDKMFLNIAVFS